MSSGSEHPGSLPSAIHDQHQAFGQGLRIAGFGLRGEILQQLEHPCFVSQCAGVRWVVQFWKFDGGGPEWTAQAGDAGGSSTDVVKDRLEFAARGFDPSADDFDPVEKPVVDLLEVGGDQVVFAGEVLVEAHFGHAGFFDDRVDADRPVALTVEQSRGGLEDAFAWFEFWDGEGGHGYIV